MDFSDGIVLKECLNWVVGVTKEAGQIVKEGFYRRDVAVNTKDGFYDLVTVYDGRTEEFLLSAIKEKYPGHKFIAEESSAEAGSVAELTDEPTWIIDPIDGTSNFVHKIGLIAVGIALTYRKQVVLAVSYNPIMDEMFTATLGGGAFLNGESIRVSSAKSSKEAVIGDEICIACLPSATNPIMSRSYHTVTQVAGVRALGSAVLSLAYVAAGRLDAYVVEYLKPWDVAGGSLLVEEAGGVVRDSRTGGKFDIMQPYIQAAASIELYEELRSFADKAEKNPICFQ